jgi:hypothetical protein
MIRSFLIAVTLAASMPAAAFQVQPYVAPQVQLVQSRGIESVQAERVAPISSNKVGVYQPPAATLVSTPGQATSFKDGVYLTINECTNLHCDAVPGMIGVMDSIEGVALQYARQWLTLFVMNANDMHKIVESRHVGVFSNGRFDANITGYDKPAGKYVFLLMAGDNAANARQVAAGIFTVTKTARPDPYQPMAMNVIGNWYGAQLGGVQTYGSLRLNADGTYSKDGLSGHYVASGGHLHFDGPLSNWNNGDAVTTVGGSLVFHWIKNGRPVVMTFNR